MEDALFSIAAQIDLLGFASHLIVGATDIRTEIGRKAIERLRSIEEAITLLEQGHTKYQRLHPDGLEVRRFNDSLFLGIDLERLSPRIGEHLAPEGISIADVKKEQSGKSFEEVLAECERDGAKTAKFLGLVARVHSFINKKEKERAFPGCRTVVASGMRQRFTDRTNTDGFFSANFAVSNAYLTAAKGRRVGIRGNGIYVEDNIGRIIVWAPRYNAILALAKFLPTGAIIDPYQYQGEAPNIAGMFPMFHWRCEKPVRVNILRQEFTFRQLNPVVLTTLQLSDLFWEEYAKLEDKWAQEIMSELKKPTPSLDEINATNDRNWILRLAFDLDDDYEKWVSVGG